MPAATKALPNGRRTRALALKRRIESLERELEDLLKKSPAQMEEGIQISAPQTRARSSPIDQIQNVLDATAGLRESNGNLSAVRIADLYGISVSQLADWIGRSRQSVSKTPDAESLQPALNYFERVARLRLIIRSDEGFRKWLRMPHSEIAAKSPLELLARGKWQALADFVDDMLTGTPG